MTTGAQGATADCPKRMEYGPCGGVLAGGVCELGDRPCAFVDVETIRWSGLDRAGAAPSPAPSTSAASATSAATAMRALLDARPVVVADLSVRPMSAAAVAQVGAVLAGRVDAVLVGDSPGERVQFPPVYRAVLLERAGVPAWSGMHCRDRNRVALEGELAALADAGVAGVHCVTGDHTASGTRPDAAPVFDLDSTELAALARAAGHLVSVAESPAAPPVERRPARLAQKVSAGAEVCFVDHCGGAVPASAFVRATGLAGSVRFLACVPLVIDASSAALLGSFPGLVLPEGFLAAIAGAADPRAAGIEAAVRMAGDLLTAGLDGVDLSGGAGPDRAEDYAEAVVAVADRLALA